MIPDLNLILEGENLHEGLSCREQEVEQDEIKVISEENFLDEVNHAVGVDLGHVRVNLLEKMRLSEPKE